MTRDEILSIIDYLGGRGDASANDIIAIIGMSAERDAKPDGIFNVLQHSAFRVHPGLPEVSTGDVKVIVKFSTEKGELFARISIVSRHVTHDSRRYTVEPGFSLLDAIKENVDSERLSNNLTLWEERELEDKVNEIRKYAEKHQLHSLKIEMPWRD